MNAVLESSIKGTGCDFNEFLTKHLAGFQKCLEEKHNSELQLLRKENARLLQELACGVPTNMSSSDGREEDVMEPCAAEERRTNLEEETAGQPQTRRNVSPALLQRGKREKMGRGQTSSYQQNAQMDVVQEFDLSSVVTSREKRDSNPCFQKLVWHPEGSFRIGYDILSFSLMMYEILTIPLESSGLVNPTEVLFLQVAGLFSTIFWTSDLVLSFFRGFQTSGVVELRVRQTMCKYLKTYFIIDFVVVSSDWVTFMISSTNTAGIARSAKALRLSRVARLFRLLRLGRIPKLASHLRKNGSQLSVTTAKITGWVIGILFLNHVVACFWFWLGDSSNAGWVSEAKRFYELSAGTQPDRAYLYLTSLHWACTQFTPASMEVVPQTSFERLTAIVVVFSSLVLCSSFLTSITATVTAIRRRQGDYIVAHGQLVQYLQENEVPMDLGCSILDLVAAQKARREQVKRIHEPEVTLLTTVPKSLQQALKLHVYKPTFDKHLILKFIGHTIGSSSALKICCEAMSQASLVSGEDLFTFGADGKAMYYMVDGEMLYYEGAMPSLQETAVLARNDFFCDPVLWMKWEHKGRATARILCEMMLIDSVTCQGIAAKIPELGELCRDLRFHYQAMLEGELTRESDICTVCAELEQRVRRSTGESIRLEI